MTERIGDEEFGIFMAGAVLTYFGDVIDLEVLDEAERSGFHAWMKVHMPWTSEAIVTRAIEEVVQSMLDEKVLAGELTAERVDGRTVYRTIGAPDA